MTDSSTEPILQRLCKLTAAISSSGIECNENTFPGHLLAKEGLLDALLVLYDECNNDSSKKNNHISKFVQKYRPTIRELRRLRVNLNDFEQKKVIGKGHFGVVKVVREKQTGNVFALKILQKAETLTQHHVSFYEEERDIMAKASSPWLTHLQYAFQDDCHLYLVMDFHPGGDLLSLLDRYNYNFTEEMSRFYLAEITVAIQVLHNMGYVHRDVKPDNILIDRCGHIKLADFGSASKLSPNRTVLSEMPVGTPDYIAPELLTSVNKTSKCDQSYGLECDFWSLGIMAYEMLYGETPFKGDTVVLTYSNIMDHEKTLKFPEVDQNAVSESAKSLIKGLVSTAESRLGYKSIIKHSFFLRTDWNNLESVRPPFIPVITSLEDTSNFEEFECKQSTPNVEAFRTKQPFSCHQLPFVGFTYTRSTSNETHEETICQSFVTASFNSTILESKPTLELEAELKAKKKALHEAHLKIKRYSEVEHKNAGLAEMEKRAAHAERRVGFLEEELSSLRKESVEGRVKIQKLKELMANEKSESSKTQAKTLEFLKSVKEKWKKNEEERLKHLTEKVELYRKTAESISEHKDEALKQLVESNSELKKTQTVASKYRENFKDKGKELLKLKTEMDELRNKQINETNEFLLGENKNKENMIKRMEELKVINEELKRKQSRKEDELEESEAERKALEQQIHQLRVAFNDQTNENKNIGNELTELQAKCLPEKESIIHQLEVKLNYEHEQSCQLKLKIEEISNDLNETLASRESFENAKDSFGEKLRLTEEELEVLSREKSKLQLELSLVSSREDEKREKIENLECLLASLKGTLDNLEIKQLASVDKIGKEKMEAQLELLEKQLKASQDSSAAAVEKMHISEDKANKMSKEVSDLKLDLRSSQRELRQCQDTVQFLRERSNELRDQIKEKENEIKEWSKKESELEKSKRTEEGKVILAEKRKEDLQVQNKDLSDKFEKVKEEKMKLKEEIENLNKKILTIHTETDRTKLAKRVVESELEILKNELEKNKEHASSVKDSVSRLQSELETAKSTIEELKSICSEQDDQLAVVDKFEDKMEALRREKQNLENEIQKLQSEMKMTKTSVNEEKSMRMFQENRVKDLETKLTSADLEADQQNSVLQDEVYKIKDENAGLQSQISQMEREFHDVNTRLRSLEHERMELQNQLDLIKGEIEGHISHIHSLKESNFKLTDGLEEAITKGELYKKRIDEMENDLSQTKTVFEDKEIKLQSTLGQQVKLIDFLQAKVENPPKKKAILSGMFGGSKNKENFGFMVGHQYRKLDEMLAREKAHTKELSIQLSKAHAEVVSLKAQASSQTEAQKERNALEDLSNSPSVHDKNTKERMRHKIPHRWQTHLMMRAGRCSGCLGNIPFSRNASKCQDCSLVVHTKCSRNMGNTCGLPQAFARHFKQSQVKFVDENSSKDSSSKSFMKGWVKVPKSGKANWERRFATLTDKELSLFEQEPTSPSMQPIKTVSFNTSITKLRILHSVPMSELPNTNTSELPYVLKIDLKEKLEGKGSNGMYLMTSSFEEKQSWISALDYVATLIQGDCEVLNEDFSKGTVQIDMLVTLNSVSNLDVNTVVLLNSKTAVVGAVEGLFSFSKDESAKLKFRARIDGMSSVYEILTIESLGIAVFIGGKDNHLFHTNLELLRVAAEASHMAKPSIGRVPIEPEISCHLISANQHGKRTFLCAAASNRISIFVWSKERGTFEVCRQYSTQEPCSCFEFTPSSLIVGAERFYNINLKNFSIEEYLDENDTSLAYAIYGSAQMSSFPVAIIKVSGSAKHEEYLLVFYEFGIFVDASGRRTRELDLKFVSLPVAIVFRAPNLFILHHNSVEIIEIRPESYTRVRGGTFDTDSECSPPVRNACTMINKPRFIGYGFDSKSILLATSSDNGVEIMALNASFPFDPDLSLTWTDNSSIATRKINSDTSETVSLCSEMSSSSASENGNSSTLKRTTFPNFMRASKRSKKQNK